jgi:hypothetical protein
MIRQDREAGAAPLAGQLGGANYKASDLSVPVRAP